MKKRVFNLGITVVIVRMSAAGTVTSVQEDDAPRASAMPTG
jgi:hypothetical protein